MKPFLWFQFTHPGRGATLRRPPHKALITVSIHAPREGCDYFVSPLFVSSMSFQFTHPGRGATRLRRICILHLWSFNSRTPGGVRLRTEEFRRDNTRVSIHAPREGCDLIRCTYYYATPCFNSRTPGGVRHRGIYIGDILDDVSIHAPREGCDTGSGDPLPRLPSFNSRTPGGVRLSRYSCPRVFFWRFNSRTPGGVRRDCQHSYDWQEEFQFTHPGRGATQ